MSDETVSYIVLLAFLVGGIVAFFTWQFVTGAKGLWRSMTALRDRIDRTKHWP